MTENWTVPGFTHVRELGAGHSGRVVQAVDDLTQTPVAVKYLDERLRRDERFQRGFSSEARLLSRLEDPGLVQVYEYVESPQGAAVIMEMVDGVSLARLLDTQGPTGPLAALVIFGGSLMALAALHEAGIAHGAYSPSNVLIDRSGAAKLTDVAVTAGDGSDARGAAYRAPELWDGAPPGAAGDLYAATAVFVECLTGLPPFATKNLGALAKAHRGDQVPVQALPEPLRGLVAAGLAKAPGDRPRSAADLLTTLDEAAVAAYGPAWEAQGRDRLSKLAADAAAAPYNPAPPARSSGSAARPRTTRRRWPVLGAVALAAVLIVAIASVVGLRMRSDDRATPVRSSVPVPSRAPAASGMPSPEGTPLPQTPAALADAIGNAAAEKRAASFAHRRDACCGNAIAALGALSLTSGGPTASDMTVWSPVRRDPHARRVRTVLVGDTAYVALRGWHPLPAVRHAARSDATHAYASMAAQARWSASVQNILALLRSSGAIKRSGLSYTGTAPLATLVRDGSVGRLYAPFAGSAGGARVAFTVRVGADLLPRSLQVTVTPRLGGRARVQVFRTNYSNWGRKVSINAPR
ncbi:protein kinase domain-containing protein [Actinomadura sp. HBU206391]|uniref:serine/threonine-protein kinase n=1 Tax=Actinomadura sp. HBU206391 TaxID=2731692 RepID=UPI00164FA196|nr:serine/threonine-protein kinase [Actinomadura sp. HBU206391]MBC6457679.1 serine/threonine protein kinase [Actinomadura sp. HBU206391]